MAPGEEPSLRFDETGVKWATRTEAPKAAGREMDLGRILREEVPTPTPVLSLAEGEGAIDPLASGRGEGHDEAGAQDAGSACMKSPG
jgi:hypothetical protein